MGELYELFPKLPKNIRQIGERDPGFKAVCRGLCQYIFKAVKARKRGGSAGGASSGKQGDP